MFAKLRVVRMNKIVCLCNELQFMEFILSKARVLQVLSIRLGSDAECCNEEAVTCIIEYPRASSDAQVIFLGRESANTGSVYTSTAKAEVEDSQTTDSEHDSINMATDNAEVEEAETTSSGPGSISTSTANAEAEETQTTGSMLGSISMSPENAEVEDVQATCSRHASDNTSTENAIVEDTQTTGSGLVYDVCPRRRQRLDLESVVQLEQLEAEMLELQKQMQLDLENKRLMFESNMEAHNSFIQDREFMSLQDLSASLNISLPPFPALVSHLGTPRLGETPVNHAINGATSAHADPPEDRCVNSAANTDCEEDHAVNGASNASADSSEEHT